MAAAEPPLWSQIARIECDRDLENRARLGITGPGALRLLELVRVLQRQGNDRRSKN